MLFRYGIIFHNLFACRFPLRYPLPLLQQVNIFSRENFLAHKIISIKIYQCHFATYFKSLYTLQIKKLKKEKCSFVIFPKSMHKSNVIFSTEFFILKIFFKK